jgi:hypothetical protein
MEFEARMKQRGDRELRRKKPFFQRRIVEARAKAMFPNHAPAEILEVLDEYKPGLAELAPRVQLAILKLSDGDFARLRYQLDAAKSDYRDVILPAENPEFVRLPMDSWLAMSEAEKDRLSNRDVQQYLDWLQIPRPSFLSRMFSFKR